VTADPYVDLATGTLRNKLGISDADALARAEADLTRAALQELAVSRLPGDYNLAHLLAFHKAIFGDLYAWAGQVRTVSIAKPGTVFAPPQFIESYAGEVFGQLRRANYLRGLARVDFVPLIAHYYAEINAIHPAREGNGRAQRAFLGQLADDAGWPIAWRRMDAETNIVASQAGQRGELAPLVRMLGELIAGGER
jgi:cell filamentation protein, protein adenylyltransferase